jgi:hypothetical protein
MSELSPEFKAQLAEHSKHKKPIVKRRDFYICDPECGMVWKGDGTQVEDPTVRSMAAIIHADSEVLGRWARVWSRLNVIGTEMQVGIKQMQTDPELRVLFVLDGSPNPDKPTFTEQVP